MFVAPSAGHLGSLPRVADWSWRLLLRHAVVGPLRVDEARQTLAFVGALRVDALGVLAQGHSVVELGAFIHVCEEGKNDRKKESMEGKRN